MSAGTLTPEAEGDLLTVREVAALLRLKPDTLYRWAREGRLPAVKVGKEWRVHPDDIERLLGRAPQRRAGAPDPVAAMAAGLERAGEGGVPGAGIGMGVGAAAATPSPVEGGGGTPWSWPREVLERGLRSFVCPRDHLLALAPDEPTLAWVQGAFWRLAVWAGGPLVIPRRPEALEATRRRLFAAGIDLDRGDRVRLVEVADDLEAREAVAAAAGPRAGAVWACYGVSDALSAGPDAVGAHERRLDAGIVVHDTVALCGALTAGPGARDFEALMQLESLHRGTIKAARGQVLLSRNA